VSKPLPLAPLPIDRLSLIHLFHYHDHFCFAVERTHAHIHPALEQFINLSLSFASFLLIHEPLRAHTHAHGHLPTMRRYDFLAHLFIILVDR